jgi:hypothetical protein
MNSGDAKDVHSTMAVCPNKSLHQIKPATPRSVRPRSGLQGSRGLRLDRAMGVLLRSSYFLEDAHHSLDPLLSAVDAEPSLA